MLLKKLFCMKFEEGPIEPTSMIVEILAIASQSEKLSELTECKNVYNKLLYASAKPQKVNK